MNTLLFVILLVVYTFVVYRRGFNAGIRFSARVIQYMTGEHDNV
jgi:hypothetical protein